MLRCVAGHRRRRHFPDQQGSAGRQSRGGGLSHAAQVEQARQEGCELLGFYHSHPSGPAYPSQRDIAEASAFMGMLHLIIGLGEGQEVKAWCTAPANWMQLEMQRGG